jgi:hypothetical protein
MMKGKKSKRRRVIEISGGGEKNRLRGNTRRRGRRIWRTICDGVRRGRCWRRIRKKRKREDDDKATDLLFHITSISVLLSKLYGECECFLKVVREVCGTFTDLSVRSSPQCSIFKHLQIKRSSYPNTAIVKIIVLYIFNLWVLDRRMEDIRFLN